VELILAVVRYYDEIKNPMDFGTINQRLNQNKYETMEVFREDVMLVFRNCRQFNPLGTFPYLCADNVEAAFVKEWPRVMEKKLEWGEKRSLQGILSQLLKEEMCAATSLAIPPLTILSFSSFVFRVPVDPVLLQIPTYFDVIPKKDARDLGTIKQKLDADKYESSDALKADVDLMIHNAVLFNGVDSEVGQVAVVVKKRFYELLNISKSKKRKEAEVNGQPAKKLKLK
jgi:transcription initiation factor TFIID subunit 2